MLQNNTTGYRIFSVINQVLMIGLSLLCVLPVLHTLAISFSSSSAAAAGYVTLWPVEFTWKSYEFVIAKPEFLRAMCVTVLRVLLGVAINMLLTIIIAYPLSKEARVFRWRTVYVWFFVFTILFHGGLIPTYIVVKNLGLIDTIWALVLPGAVPVFNVILLLNFFRTLPKELEEAAAIDGAGHGTILWRLYVPLSLPALATVTLFTIVGHWNSWFDGLIYMNRPEHYPLQSYLQTVVIQNDLALLSSTDLELLQTISDRTTKAAQIFLAALPVLLVYPFLQRYFVKGIVVGSVKE
ncbi:carbohydrate ABC transporter permease [Paenibacillus sp. sptzw28]|uniref:carbohydrate ABC transporter permease n=1 Tax=Paenibacillus sp. sptzw28 TaxID=715179 RepID=UPI001C6F5C95|nr:carbohydrate ABC transporter permease [Paenibacillus sp. sptzw28]QYR21035.1 carbohydrate ABC transporter permease [Paenibacillus sp. sptzw28]